MSIQASSSSNKDVQNVSTRVKTTKKEIEFLKAQLQDLITSGAQTAPQIASETFVKHAEPPQPKPATKKLPEKAKTDKVTKKAEREPSPKKNRSYNVEETREFIKKQREKRAQQLKAQINVTDNRLDLRKQRLRELHQKTQELVTKNVLLKRERSNSRDGAVQVRPDKAPIKPPRPQSQDRLQPPKSAKPKSQERVPKNVDKPPQSRQSRPRSSNQVSTLSTLPQNRSRPRTREPNISLNTSLLYPPLLNHSNQVACLDKTVMPSFEETVENNEETIGLNKSATRIHDSLLSETIGLINKSAPRLHDENEISLNKSATRLCDNDETSLNKSATRDNNETIDLNQIHSPLCAKDNKETQTRGPTWLRPPPVLPYPYNFINTVKRKLQHALNSKVDVGVQNSEYTPEPKKSKEEIKELLIRSAASDAVKSFVSHKNLDLRLVENLELVPHRKNDSRPISKNIFFDYEDSDSDTSKNIPEISSENSQLDKLKLTTKSSGLEIVDSYTSDFLKESVKSSSVVQTIAGSDDKRESSEIVILSYNMAENPKSNESNKTNESTIKSLMTESQISKSVDSKSMIKSLMTESQISKSVDSKSTIKSLMTESQITKSLDSVKASELSLKEPTVSLNFDKTKNITIRQPAVTTNNNVNEIHLKFEAEVRLLNDFNESLKQFMTVEKAFENLKNKNESSVAMTTKILQNVDTQTSVVANSVNSINFSRGSDFFNETNESVLSTNNRSRSKNSTLTSSQWNLSVLNASNNSNNVSTISNVENYNNMKNCAGLSLNMFEQLIKDEDARISHLKAIIKIREQALLDRTKGELVWLEIQKKQLIETGKIEEASLLKKKQRGIILKHEQERNEIKKLKQMQKAASEERKNILKQQRNLIKSQLSTDNMLSKMKVQSSARERRSSGPLRVVQSCSESIHSETSISVKSRSEDVFSVTSRSLKVSESEVEFSRREERSKVSNVKRRLLMREAALVKRRKTAEELLRWHRKLLDEEEKIAELEAAATSVGKQLWKDTTGRSDRIYVMSQGALERLCKRARKQQKSGDVSSCSSRKSELYSYKFEPESVQEEKTKISSISQLIDNFAKIEDEISFISRKSESQIQTMTPNHLSENKEAEKTEDIPSKDTEIETPSVLEAEVATPSGLEEESKRPSDDKDEEINTASVLEAEIVTPSGLEEESKRPSDDKDEEINTASVLEAETSASDLQQEEGKIQSTIEASLSGLAGVESVPEEESEASISDFQKTKTPSVLEEGKIQSTIEASLSGLAEVETVLEEKSEASISDLQITKTPSVLEASSSDPEDITTPSVLEQEAKIQSTIEASSSNTEQVKTPSVPEEEKIQSAVEVSSSHIEEIRTPSVLEEEETQISLSNNLEEIKTPSVLEEEIKSVVQEAKTSEDQYSLEEALESASKIEESLSRLNRKLTAEEASKIEESQEDASTLNEIRSLEESSSSSEKSPRKKIDVKKRVSEILADAKKNDKSPRVQDLYVTAYDVGPTNSELIEPLEDGPQLPTDIFGSEAEELWRKQLAIEQEIKQLEQQQKEQLPYVFMREIPNKPPPPYTPPSSVSLPLSIVPSSAKEVNEISEYSSKVLYKAYLNGNLEKVKFSENGFRLFSKVDVATACAEFVFNVCKDMARDFYKQFERVEGPTWLACRKPQLAKVPPPEAAGLDRIMNAKLRELFGFNKTQVQESAIIKWGRKKRDHVDEILVVESQEEEAQWTSFECDELIVKDQVANEVMKMLIGETASVFSKILSKKKI